MMLDGHLPVVFFFGAGQRQHRLAIWPLRAQDVHPDRAADLERLQRGTVHAFELAAGDRPDHALAQVHLDLGRAGRGNGALDNDAAANTRRFIRRLAGLIVIVPVVCVVVRQIVTGVVLEVVASIRIALRLGHFLYLSDGFQSIACVRIALWLFHVRCLVGSGLEVVADLQIAFWRLHFLYFSSGGLVWRSFARKAFSWLNVCRQLGLSFGGSVLGIRHGLVRQHVVTEASVVGLHEVRSPVFSKCSAHYTQWRHNDQTFGEFWGWRAPSAGRRIPIAGAARVVVHQLDGVVVGALDLFG